jgi:hypothetical protein
MCVSKLSRNRAMVYIREEQPASKFVTSDVAIYNLTGTVPTMDSSKRTLSTARMKMNHLVKTITFRVLVLAMVLVCDFLVMLWRVLGQPIFLEGIFGLTHIAEKLCVTK